MLKKFKVILSLFIIMSLLLCIVTGCADNSGDDIADKGSSENWTENSEKDENSENGEDSENSGNGEDSENSENCEEDESSKNKTDIQVISAKDAGNFFFVNFSFNKEDTIYYGIADEEGKIFYYTDDYSSSASAPYIKFISISENAGYLCESIEGKTTYTIINTAGEKKKVFTEDDFDQILGEGGGYILVYKNTGNISKEEHSYGLINSDGEWEIALTPGTKIPNDKSYKYFGEKVFVYHDYYSNSDHYVVFDCNKNITIGFNDCFIMSTAIVDGKFIVNRTGWNSNYCTPYDRYAPSLSENELPSESCLFSVDGSHEEIAEIKYAFDKIAIYEESGYIHIWNLKNNSIAQYNDFPASSIADISFVDEYGLLIIRGLDGNLYFTVIDENGEQQFDPKICECYTENIDNQYIRFNGDRIIYKTKNGFYEMIDNKGNIIISESKQCTSLRFSGNTVYGESNDVVFFVDKDGREISFTLSE